MVNLNGGCLAILLWSFDITDCLHVFRAFKFGIGGK